jgi:hypothetical protein
VSYSSWDLVRNTLSSIVDGRCEHNMGRSCVRADLEEHGALVLGEVALQHVPEPTHDAVRVVEPAVVLRVPPQVAQVQRHVVAAYQALQLDKMYLFYK